MPPVYDSHTTASADRRDGETFRPRTGMDPDKAGCSALTAECNAWDMMPESSSIGEPEGEGDTGLLPLWAELVSLRCAGYFEPAEFDTSAAPIVTTRGSSALDFMALICIP